MRLIDADALKEIYDGSYCETSDQDVATTIDEQPTIDPVKHGEWMEEPNCWYRCSNCGQHYPSMRGYMYYNYCPNCGAQMERSEDGEA